MSKQSSSFLATVIVVALLGMISAVAAVGFLIHDAIESERQTTGVAGVDRDEPDPDSGSDSGPGSGSDSDSGSGSDTQGAAPPRRGSGDPGSLRITIQGKLVAGLPFSATADGIVGPEDESGGGWIVSSYLFEGSAACAKRNPVAAPGGGSKERMSMAQLPSGNVFLAGPFRMATRESAPDKPGTYRLCGYMTDPSATGPASYQGTLITERTVPVEARPAGVEAIYSRPGLRSGRYLARAADIEAGERGSSFAMTVEGRQADGSTPSDQTITRVVGRDLPTGVCRYVDREPDAVAGFAFDTDVVEAGGNDIYTNTFSSNFKGDIHLVGGAADDDTIHATLTYSTVEGCTGSIALIARRQ